MTVERFFRPFVHFVMRFYWLIIVIAIGASAICIPKVIHLFKNIDTDPVGLLSEDVPSVKSLIEIRDRLKPKRRFVILLESDHPEKTQQAADALAAWLQGKPGIGKVYGKKEGFEFFKNHQMLYLPIEDLGEIRDKIDRKIQHTKLGPLFVSFDDSSEDVDLDELKDKYLAKTGEESFSEYFVSPNGRIYGIFIESPEPVFGVSKEKRFQDDVKKAVGAFDYKAFDPSMTMLYSGTTRVEEYRALIHDLKVAGIISGILIFLPLLISFRKPQSVFLIFLPLAVGIPIGLGIATIWIKQLNVTTSFLFGILGGLGVETGIHLFSRYHYERSRGNNVETSLLDLFTSVGPAIFTSVSALAVTFLLMIFSNFRGFSEFGLISGIGLYVLFILYFSFFPALLVLFEKLHLMRWKPFQEEKEFTLTPSPRFVRILLALFTAATVASLFAIPKLAFEYDTKKIRADNPTQEGTRIKQRAVGSKRFSKGLVMVKNEREARAIEEAVAELKQKKPATLVDVVQSVYTLVPRDQAAKMTVVQQMVDLLSDDSIELVKGKDKANLEEFKTILKNHRPFQLADVPEEARTIFTGDVPGADSFLLIYTKPGIELDDARNAIRFAEDVQQIHTSAGTFRATNDAIVFADVIRTLFKDSRLIILASCLSVMTFIYLSFRSLKKTALVMYSIIAGVLWVLGVMYLAGIKFNLYNMVMIPAIMGMSIDNSIHIYHRYEELGTGSLGKVLGSTGVSALLASLTNGAGFIGLAFCTHGGLRSMGVIVLIGLATCLVSTLVYLPMILEFLEKRKSPEVVPNQSALEAK